jgi:hypothetical protein
MKRLASILLVGAILLTGCGGAKTDSAKTDSAKTDGAKSGGTVTVTVASMSPLSGANADLGESIRYATELAIKDRAADLEKVGLKVNFIAMDDQGKPEQGTQLAEQLLTKKEVVAVVGCLNSGVSIPVSPPSHCMVTRTVSRFGLESALNAVAISSDPTISRMFTAVPLLTARWYSSATSFTRCGSRAMIIGAKIDENGSFARYS